MIHWHSTAIWLISLVSIALVLIRPKGLAEAWWATGGAAMLVLCRLLSPASAARAIGKGLDVYLFLIGMMIISELARRAGVFDWVAGHAVEAAKGRPTRLFVLIYGVGTVVTVFLSNDATAVVLTPAVLAAVRAAEADPLPYLLICAFIANAASFVLPISNPANLVVYRGAMPPLGQWLHTFGLPSAASILITFVMLRWLANHDLKNSMKSRVEHNRLSSAGKITICGVVFLAAILMTASAFNLDLGAPACVAGLLVAAAVSVDDSRAAGAIARKISWSVIPLVASLFVIVEAINSAGALRTAVETLQSMKTWQPAEAALTSGFGVALISNLINNLPSGLISGTALQAAGVTGALRHAILIGVDLGPNLSVSGSLATILWLIAIRREGQHVGFFQFLRWGVIVMPPALAAAILMLLLAPHS